MKKNLFLIPVLIFVLPLFAIAKPAKIKGIIKNSSSVKYVYLFEFFGADVIKKDSALITNNSFSFNSKDGYPRGFYQLRFDEKNNFNLILSDEDLVIEGDLQNLNSSLKISNSAENEVYNSFRSFIEIQNGMMRTLQTEANKASALQTTNPTAFQARMGELQKKYDSMMASQQDYYKTLAEQHKELFIGKFMQELVIKPEHNKDNYLTASHFNDPELLRSDVLVSKINIYLQRFHEQSVDSWKEAAENLIEKTSGTKGQEVVFLSLLNTFSSVDMDLTTSFAQRYAKAYPKSEKAKSILASLPKAGPSIGDIAPDIKLPAPDGKDVALTSLRGKVVLLDFWASWCGPCRMENPNVVNVFNKYKDKGFTVFSVSLDSDRNKWLQAVEKDKMTWVHVSDLKNWNSAGAALYGVRSIPATYLIDKDGKIIAKNLRGEKLEEELKKHLK